MNILTPKAQFQTNETARTELATVVRSSNFHSACSFALADYAARSIPSAEQLGGARAFLHVLLNLPFPDEPPPEFPVRRLGAHLKQSTE